ncbi:MAG TPA: YcaO-like family protein [Terracidiphilus sp.]|nr:YcaO-like family protein [Terracidiphilus sp.]
MLTHQSALVLDEDALQRAVSSHERRSVFASHTMPAITLEDVASLDLARSCEQHWELQPLPKYSRKGVVRCVPPIATIRRATAVLKPAGITRIADVTHLDRVGIPNFMSVRPLDLDPGISYYNGKGTTRDDAHAGAIMEGIERHAGEYCDYEVVVSSFNELRKYAACVKPDEIIVPATAEYSDDLEIEWVCGYDLLQSQRTFVPLNAVICPYTPKTGPVLFYASSNGLASGNTLIEALCHAICEIVERDAQAISVARSELRPLLRAMVGRSGSGETSSSPKRRISLSELPRRAQLLVNKLKNAGQEVYLYDLTCTAGIATIECSIVEKKIDGSGDAYGGVGAHPDARVALLRAITEAAQSRLACIQGGREDLPEIVRHRTCDRIDEVFDQGRWVSFGEIPSIENERIDDDVRLLLSRLPECGLRQLVAFDMTHAGVGIPVVRVVIPLAETWPVFHLHTGRGTFGPRIAQEL